MTNTYRRQGRRRLLAGAMVLALLASACGGDDDDVGDEPSAPATQAPSSETADTASEEPADTTAQSGTETTAPATTDPAEVLGISIVSTPPSFTSFPQWVMNAEDLFAANGLDVDADLGADNAALIAQAVIAGDKDFGISGTGAVYNAYAEGMTDLVIIATVSQSLTFGLALTNDAIDRLAEQGVTPDSPVEERVQALRGLRIGASPAGSTGYSYVAMMLSEHGLDIETDITLVPNNDGTAQVAAAREGRIDGYALSFPNSLIPEAEGFGQLWLNWAEDLPSLVPFAAHSIYTSRSYLAEHREEAVRLVRALWQAHDAITNRPDEIKDGVKEVAFPDLDQAVFDKGYELAVNAYAGSTPVTTEEMFQRQLALVNNTRDTPMEASITDLYDLSVADEAKPQ